MELREKISRQVDAGFTAAEIETNLLADGYSPADVRQELANVPAQIATAKAPTSPWKVIWSVIIGILVVIRLIRLLVNLAN